MSKHYFSICVNLDKRDSNGKPEVIEIPSNLREEELMIFAGDTLYLTYSVIEKGIEKIMATHMLITEGNPAPAQLTKHDVNQTEKLIV